jgi:hypothetical protein
MLAGLIETAIFPCFPRRATSYCYHDDQKPGEPKLKALRQGSAIRAIAPGTVASASNLRPIRG